ncbi:hypothetical protein EPUS_03337 [Endocarpon pusillum Z07020]|uniref:Uncharacterized protein n=1 Tax=Endocarpon pusillum (strain Z07020 / HMAS-L-300199) TaxID=1263415 RepID=U1G1E5_ENDPU|nr:uncharacterized protein EPUS_03337 [Endocarpon pusillum Z07020]ERF71057.1 hypothetical protein EPUS_03337 [Endocarpon pusillum Z07020]
MNPDNSYPHPTASAITVMTDIRSQSPLMKGSINPEDRLIYEEFGQAEQRNAAAANAFKMVPRTIPSSTRSARGSIERHTGPVAHDKNMLRVLPLIHIPTSFKENPEWRQYYNQSSKPAETKQQCLLDTRSTALPEHSLIKTNNSSTETFITANTLLDQASMKKAGLDSRKLLRLPRSRSSQNILKAGNMRLKQLIRPKHNTYFRTEAVVGADQDIAGQLQKPDFIASQKDLRSRDAKARMERLAKGEAIHPPRSLRNKESSTSIIDLDQVEARHGLEKYHRSTLSKSWDEIFKSVGGFKSGSDGGNDELCYNEAQLHFTGVNVTKPVSAADSISASKLQVNTSQNVDAKGPHVPAPRTSNITTKLVTGPTRQSFQVLVKQLPARPTPTRQSKQECTNQRDWATETDMHCMQVKASLTPHLREARSFEVLSQHGSAPNTSQSTIALEAIEAEMNNGQPVSPSTLMGPSPPLSLNSTPPQLVAAPTDPPAGPLPELPEEFRKAGASSRASSQHSTRTRLTCPTTSPGPKHRKTTSANSSSSNLTLQAMKSSQGHYRHQTSPGTRSLKEASTISSARSVLAAETPSRTHPQRKAALAVSESVNVSGSDQYYLGSSQDLRSLAASDIDRGYDMIDTTGLASTKFPFLTNDALSSRRDHIKELKMRDLAQEKAARIRSQSHLRSLEEASVAAKPSSTANKGSPRHIPLVPVSPFDTAHKTIIGGSSQASRRPNHHIPCSLSIKTSQSTMTQSQIMVLAETNPDTQLFCASTPTRSVRRTDSGKAMSGIGKEMKPRKRRSKTRVRCHVNTAVALNGATGGKPSGQYTPPLSEPSPHSSGDDMENTHRPEASQDVNDISPLAAEEGDFESTPSKQAFAVLARKEEKKYLKEQLLLRKLKRESSDLKLAMKLLSRGLEKLTTFVETDEGLNEVKGRELLGAEMERVKRMAESFECSLSPEDWEGLDQDTFRHDHPEKHTLDDVDVSLRGAKSARVDDNRPLSLVSRYSSVRNSMGESVISGPPLKDETIRNQLEGFNRATMLKSGSLD